MSSNRNFGNVCAFIAMVVLVLSIVISKVFVWLNIGSTLVTNILDLVGWFATVIALGIAAYEFCAKKGKTYLIIFWIAAIIIVVFRFI